MEEAEIMEVTQKLDQLTQEILVGLNQPRKVIIILIISIIMVMVKNINIMPRLQFLRLDDTIIRMNFRILGITTIIALDMIINKDQLHLLLNISNKNLMK
jgi:hypothetical protein